MTSDEAQSFHVLVGQSEFDTADLARLGRVIQHTDETPVAEVTPWSGGPARELVHWVRPLRRSDPWL